MFKIKLLILFSISYFFISCTNNKEEFNYKISVGYIGGEYEGLLLSNQLKSQLNNLGMFNENSKYEIQANISHSKELYITNIDKTSDRELINSYIDIKIFNKKIGCITYEYIEEISQFYVLASSDQFISNNIAVEEIKIENTEYFVLRFINSLTESSFVCGK
tara:strand:+ start:55 stop:540 length:486 start_codon:yes stop_codon:yes gene_type:complete